MSGSTGAGRCFAIDESGIVLSVRVTTRAGRDEVDGIGVLDDGRAVARIRVRARPHEGAANAAVLALLAKTFKRPKSQVSLIAGATSRLKRIRIEGDPRTLAATIEDWPSR